MLDQKRFHLTNCRYVLLLKIISKINYIILVKKIWTNYDLTMTGKLTICGCGPRLIIVSNSCYVLLARKLVGPNTITIWQTV